MPERRRIVGGGDDAEEDGKLSLPMKSCVSYGTGAFFCLNGTEIINNGAFVRGSWCYKEWNCMEWEHEWERHKVLGWLSDSTTLHTTKDTPALRKALHAWHTIYYTVTREMEFARDRFPQGITKMKWNSFSYPSLLPMIFFDLR